MGTSWSLPESCCAIPCMDSFLYVGISSAFFHSSSTGRFLRGCRKYGLIFSGILMEDGMWNLGTVSDVAGCVGWEDIRRSLLSVH